jgi:hypothetical protein
MKTCKKGLHTYEGAFCEECQRKAQTSWRASHRDRCNAASIKSRKKHPQKFLKTNRECSWRRAGIQLDFLTFLDLLASQRFRCLICNAFLSVSASVDHDHRTGQVRGLLCFSCNNGLGSFKDSVELLQRSLEYLKGH